MKKNSNPQHSENRCSVENAVIATIGGAGAIICGYPFDTTKVRLHLDPHRKAPSVWSTFERLRRHGVAHGFFAGMSLPLATSFLSNSFQFAVFCYTLHALEADRELEYAAHTSIFMAGCIGGAAQLFVSCPSDVVKVILQGDVPITQLKFVGGKPRIHTSPFEVLGEIVRRRGVRGLYRGVGAMAARDLPGYGLYLLFFKILEEYVQSSNAQDPHGLLTGFVAGGVACSMSWGLLTPFDVIKTRLQADVLAQKYQGFWDCLHRSVKLHGARVLYRAFLPTVVRAFPAGAWSGFFYKHTSEAMESLSAHEVPKRWLRSWAARHQRQQTAEPPKGRTDDN